MLYGLDCLAPPSDTAARLMLRYGWSWLNCYIGGPFLSGHTPWPNERVSALAAIGFRFLPLYVGQQLVPGRPDLQGTMTYDQGVADGTEATILTGACGFNESTILGLDLEAGSYEADNVDVREYVRGFVEVGNSAGHPVVLYSDALTAEHLATPDLVDYKWVSDPIVAGRNYRKAPVGFFDPTPAPRWDAWQFAFGGLIGGVTCDLNSADETFPLAEYST